jgi:hypothetical protein
MPVGFLTDDGRADLEGRHETASNPQKGGLLAARNKNLLF